MTVSQWLTKTHIQLTGANISTARLDAEVLLAHVLGVEKTWLIAHDDTVLTASDTQKAGQLVEQRLQRTPVAYLFGYKEFYGREFVVTPDTLIPRPESEALIDLAKKLTVTPARVLDVGTGSGCLGITLKLEIPTTDITLSDISQEALEVAAQNASTHSAAVTTVQSDLLKSFTDPATAFDVIVANLPYVDASWDDVSPEISHEPESALFAADGGLKLIKQLIDQTPQALGTRGYLLLEADPTQHAAICDYATDFTYVEAHDYAIALQLI